MSQRKDPQSCKSQLSAWTSMIFHTAIILHLTDINGGESLADSQYRMLAVIGHMQNITLPCSVNPAADAVDEMVEWSRSDMNPRFVHLRRAGEDHLVDQNPSYKGRTSVSTDRLKTGDASLQLTKVRLSDEGTYRCFIPRLNTDLSVELVVEADIKITKVSTGMLECKSEGWHPEPEVFWLDSEQKLLSAGPKEVFRGPADLYTLSSRLTLEKGQSSNFICRVQQNNQHREATIHVPDDFFMASSPSARSVVGGLIAGVMFLIVVFFLIWKWRKNKMGPKKSCEDGEARSGREDSRCSSSKDPEKESLMKKKDECKAGSETLMNQGKVEVHDPAHASEQPGLSCENKDDTSIHAAQTTQNERQQNNGQPGRDATKDVCSSENTQSDDKRPSVTATVTLPKPLGSNIKIPNQSLMDSSGQQQQRKQGEEVKNDTDKEEDTKKTQTTNDETAGQSKSEEEGKQNTEVQEKDGDGEKTGSANKETAELLCSNSKIPIQNLMDSNGQQQQLKQGEEVKNDTDKKEDTNKTTQNRQTTEETGEEDSESKSNTQSSYPENNGTNQEPSGSTDQENSEKKQSGNNSETDEGPEDKDQHGNSAVSRDATSGLKHQNNDNNGKKTKTTDDETTASTNKGTSHHDEAKEGEGKKEQGDIEKDSNQQPDAESSHAGSSVHSGNNEHSNNEESLATNGDSAVTDLQQGTSSTSSAATSVVKHQDNDGNGEKTDSNKELSHHDEAEGGEGQTGQGDTDKGSKPEYDT